jgi:hypothetical protein
VKVPLCSLCSTHKLIARLCLAACHTPSVVCWRFLTYPSLRQIHKTIGLVPAAGCLLLAAWACTGSTLTPSSHGLLTTVAHRLGPQATPCYALEGSVAVAGLGISWLRDNLRIIDNTAECEDIAKSVSAKQETLCWCRGVGVGVGWASAGCATTYELLTTQQSVRTLQNRWVCCRKETLCWCRV